MMDSMYGSGVDSRRGTTVPSIGREEAWLDGWTDHVSLGAGLECGAERCLDSARNHGPLGANLPQAKESGESMRHLSSFSKWAGCRLAASCVLLVLISIVGTWPAWAQSVAPQATRAATHQPYTFGDVVKLSVFGLSDPATFTPLRLRDFGDGWLQPWIAPPNGSSGALRGGWVNTFSAFFSREIDPSYSFTSAASGGRDEHVGAAAYLTPVNRRLELGLAIPFVDILASANGSRNAAGGLGDIVFTPKVMLQETQDLSLSLGAGVRMPTGEQTTGNGVTAVSPFIAFWRDLGAKWQARGGIGADVFTGGASTLPDAVFRANLALGTTLSAHASAPLGDLTPYVSMTLSQDIGNGPDTTTFSVTPGIRTYLGWSTYFITGVEIPVTHPEPFDWRLTAVVSIGW